MVKKMFTYVDEPRKHRYIFFQNTGAEEKKSFLGKLKYDICLKTSMMQGRSNYTTLVLCEVADIDICQIKQVPQLKLKN